MYLAEALELGQARLVQAVHSLVGSHQGRLRHGQLHLRLELDRPGIARREVGLRLFHVGDGLNGMGRDEMR